MARIALLRRLSPCFTACFLANERRAVGRSGGEGRSLLEGRVGALLRVPCAVLRAVVLRGSSSPERGLLGQLAAVREYARDKEVRAHLPVRSRAEDVAIEQVGLGPFQAAPPRRPSSRMTPDGRARSERSPDETGTESRTLQGVLMQARTDALAANRARGAAARRRRRIAGEHSRAWPPRGGADRERRLGARRGIGDHNDAVGEFRIGLLAPSRRVSPVASRRTKTLMVCLRGFGGSAEEA
jgi:hypothetical protein